MVLKFCIKPEPNRQWLLIDGLAEGRVLELPWSAQRISVAQVLIHCPPEVRPFDPQDTSYDHISPPRGLSVNRAGTSQDIPEVATPHPAPLDDHGLPAPHASHAPRSALFTQVQQHAEYEGRVVNVEHPNGFTYQYVIGVSGEGPPMDVVCRMLLDKRAKTFGSLPKMCGVLLDCGDDPSSLVIASDLSDRFRLRLLRSKTLMGWFQPGERRIAVSAMVSLLGQDSGTLEIVSRLTP